ncbi:hypothetical protein NE237_013549 [Protea cynaroides]|uniref:AAA+ ATPase domain-containing protein n=1 Tax=Protea cynaroides TaxID=273540 RepID=A0A9Q0GYY3_9MAGN|nr:hypothetical protein NE237_013549 [Protea cynaroides]
MQEKDRELKAARNDRRHELGQAENVGQVTIDKARNWCEVVNETEMEATGVEERHQWTCACGLCKAGDMLNQQFDLATRPLPKSVIEIESEPKENLQPSTQNMVQKMLDGLGDTKIGIIGVHGMGGVGKTTLAKKVNNHFKDNSSFETVIMVTRLRLDLPKEDVDDAREKLLDALRKKKFLLILDDVWNKLELKGIGNPHPRNHKGSKILITSRYKDTCTHMDAELKLEVKPLSRDESCNLFCKGLPLAIVTVARAMADRDGVGEWADVVREMEKSTTQNIFENDISDYCVGEGLVDKLSSLMAVKNIGEAMIKSLKIASMLGLALWITSSGFDGSPKFLTRAGGSFKEAPDAKEWLDATRISLMDTQIEKFSELGDRCPKLTTLLFRKNKILTIVPHTNFFQHVDHLNVLDLSFSSKLEYLPDSLLDFVNLRVLRLHGCSRLRALPALGMLR